ncbi:Endonuclease III [Aquisphaera giovannonii]|uniref:Endonuclease III n=1 Tax=Aquisphaera giovannonii TaxID=406548 RepID=A0A5B9VZ34_9BACT|nr:endonuclease [Aquisphaera giovannonii]QEH33035.1 Endonuclease III [Aquisphaera giovannonii]
MATQSKSQFLNDIHSHLKRRYKPKPDRAPGRLSILEAVVYGVCHEDVTREQANQALSRFKDSFFDWNDVRVSHIDEVREALADIPDPEARAQRIRRFLRQLFEKTYGFNLDALAKKPLKEALKALQAYEAFHSDFVTATVTQLALGGHAIPVDSSTRRALDRLGVAEPDIPTLRAVLERAVPKNRGQEFIELVEELAHDTCVPGTPDCPRCELRKLCPYAHSAKEAAKAGGRSGATKPAEAPAAPAAPEKDDKKPRDAAKEHAKKPGASAPAPPPPAKKPPPRASAPPEPPKPPPTKRGGK